MLNSPTTIQKKICLFGDVAVGKTSLVRRFVEGRFDDRYLSTIGVKVSRRLVELGERRLNLLIWDLAGNEEFNGLQANYIHGAAGALLVCDLTRADTLNALERYARHLWNIHPGVPVFLVANKHDLVAQRRLDEQEIAAVAANLAAPYLLTSALTGVGVEQAFHTLSQQVLNHG